MVTAMVAASSSCTSGSRRPSLIVIVDTDLPAGRSGGPAGATELLLSTAYGAGANRRTTSQRIPNGPLPQSFVVLSPRPGSEQLIDIRIDVLRGANSLLHTRATALIPAQGTREVVLFLAAHCLELESQCADSQTCTLRGCEDPAQAVATAVEQPSALDARPWYDATCVSPNGGPCSSEASVPDATPDAAAIDATASDATDATADVVGEPRGDAGAEAAIDAAPRDGAADSGDASCNADAMDCVGFVRPLQPQSTSTVHTRRPTFRWTHSPSVTPESLVLCADRACATRRATIALASSSRMAVSSVDLPQGVTFWRVNARRNWDGQAVASPTWFVVVNRASATQTTSSGTTFDVNADGVADVAIGAPNQSSDAGVALTGKVFVHYGAVGGLSGSAAITLTGTPGENFGTSVSSAGDVNGDGFADMIVGAPQSALAGPGRAYVYQGGAMGLSSPRTLSVPAEGGFFGSAVAGAGDVDGDGYGDVIVSAVDAMTRLGRVHLYRGSATGISTTATVSISGTDPDAKFGVSVAGIGDVNGDGFSDFAVGANVTNSHTGRVTVFYGASSNTMVTSVLTPPNAGQFGISVAGAGDVNGDGYSDMIVGAHETPSGGMMRSGVAYLYLGANLRIVTTPAVTYGSDMTLGRFGESVSGGADIDGDGFSDVLVGAYTQANGGTLRVFRGSSGPLSTTPALMLTGSMINASVTGLGRTVALLGDTNGDGLSEYAAASLNNNGQVFLFNGSPVFSATNTMIGMTSASVRFGASIAAVSAPRARSRAVCAR